MYVINALRGPCFLVNKVSVSVSVSVYTGLYWKMKSVKSLYVNWFTMQLHVKCLFTVISSSVSEAHLDRSPIRQKQLTRNTSAPSVGEKPKPLARLKSGWLIASPRLGQMWLEFTVGNSPVLKGEIIVHHVTLVKNNRIYHHIEGGTRKCHPIVQDLSFTTRLANS